MNNLKRRLCEPGYLDCTKMFVVVKFTILYKFTNLFIESDGVLFSVFVFARRTAVTLQKYTLIGPVQKE